MEFSILVFIPIIGLNVPTVKAADNVYLVSNDIIKNFQFESFDYKPLTAGGESQDRKLKFEFGAVWRIEEGDVEKIGNVITDGSDVYIRYKVAMRNKINMYTTIDINQASEYGLKKVEEPFLVAKYSHYGLYGHFMRGWDDSIDWTHYDFGDIKTWNYANNDFSGDLVMSFDIAQSPLPNFQTQSGDAISKNFDYIAVSSITIENNIMGKLDDSTPTIVGLTPRDYEASDSSKSQLDAFGSTSMWDANYDPNIKLEIFDTPMNSFDGAMGPQTPGSTMFPKTKSGDNIWNPESRQTSMKDCEFRYNIGSLSPVVTEYYGQLSYDYIEYETEDRYTFWPFSWEVRERSNTQKSETETRPVALHVTNRYIQAEVKVVFDVFASYNIDVGADGIEDIDLDFPMEYYDLLLWLTTVDGFGGGYQRTDSGTGWFSALDDWWIWIIIIIVIVIAGYLFIKIGMPLILSKKKI